MASERPSPYYEPETWHRKKVRKKDKPRGGRKRAQAMGIRITSGWRDSWLPSRKMYEARILELQEIVEQLCVLLEPHHPRQGSEILSDPELP